jgi:hypothetical protein
MECNSKEENINQFFARRFIVPADKARAPGEPNGLEGEPASGNPSSNACLTMKLILIFPDTSFPLLICLMTSVMPFSLGVAPEISSIETGTRPISLELEVTVATITCALCDVWCVVC